MQHFPSAMLHRQIEMFKELTKINCTKQGIEMQSKHGDDQIGVSKTGSLNYDNTLLALVWEFTS